MNKRINNQNEFHTVDNNFREELSRTLNVEPTTSQKKKAKHVFMAEVHSIFDHSPSLSHTKKSPYFSGVSFFTSHSWVKYTAFILVGILVLNGGAVLYADTTNVPITHPLYQYKRVAEYVQLTVASEDKKPELEAKIAERRTQEIRHVAVLQQSGKLQIEITATSSGTSTNVSGTTSATSTFSTTSTSHSSSSDTKTNKKLEKTKAKLEAEQTRLEKKQKKLQADVEKQVTLIEQSLNKLSEETRAAKKVKICTDLTKIELESATLFNDASAQAKIKSQIHSVCAAINMQDPANVQNTTIPNQKLENSQKSAGKNSVKINNAANVSGANVKAKSSVEKNPTDNSVKIETEAGSTKKTEEKKSSSVNETINIHVTDGANASASIQQSIQSKSTQEIQINVKPNVDLP
jgi:hypothetical protein